MASIFTTVFYFVLVMFEPNNWIDFIFGLMITAWAMFILFGLLFVILKGYGKIKNRKKK